MITVMRNPTFKGFKYKSNFSDNEYCFANYTFGLGLKNISLYENNEKTVSLKQENTVLKLFSIIPILSAFLYVPYKIYDSSKQLIGTANILFFNPIRIFKIANEKYFITELGNNIFNVTLGDKLLLVITKSPISSMEQNKYDIDCKENFDNWLILLICSFIDAEWFPNNFRINSYRYEKRYIKRIKKS
jgi:hypothetical protein